MKEKRGEDLKLAHLFPFQEWSVGYQGVVSEVGELDKATSELREVKSGIYVRLTRDEVGETDRGGLMQSYEEILGFNLKEQREIKV